MRITDEFVFFWKDPIAQWHLAAMTDPTDGNRIYNCCEQYMMAKKALLFEDKKSFDAIMKAGHPKHQQELGRSVANYDQNEWNEKKFDVVQNACMLKFTQHPKLLAQLLDSGDRLFVEASPTDLIWGIGMKEDDPGVEDPNNWRGENLLGQALTETRNYIREILLSPTNLITL